MRAVGTIRPSQTQEITAEGIDDQAALDALRAQVPEGFDLIAVRVVK